MAENYQAPLSMGFPRHPGIEPMSPALQAVLCMADGFFTDRATREALTKGQEKPRKHSASEPAEGAGLANSLFSELLPPDQ